MLISSTLYFVSSLVVCLIYLGNNVSSYIVATDPSLDPYGILRTSTNRVDVSKHCIQLCSDCNGVAKPDGEICRCIITTADYPVQCIERMQTRAERLGLKMEPKPFVRKKRETECPNAEYNSRNGASRDSLLGAPGPTRPLSTFTGVVLAPVLEQVKAILVGDSEHTIPGQFMAHLPKTLSSATNLLDAVNLASPRIVSPIAESRDAEEEANYDSGTDIFETLFTLPMVDQFRAALLGDPESDQQPVPLQIINHLPKAVSQISDMLNIFDFKGNQKNLASPQDVLINDDKKSKIDDFYDSLEYGNADDTMEIPLSQNIIVSPVGDNNQPKLPSHIPINQVDGSSLSSKAVLAFSPTIENDVDDIDYSFKETIPGSIDAGPQVVPAGSNAYIIIVPSSRSTLSDIIKGVSS